MVQRTEARNKVHSSVFTFLAASSRSLFFSVLVSTLFSSLFSEDDLSSILESLSMSDVAAPVDQSNYRSQPLAVRDRFIGATVARRMFVAKAAPPWMVNALLEELMTEVVREVVLETVADVSYNDCDQTATKPHDCKFRASAAVSPIFLCCCVRGAFSFSSRRRRAHCRMPS